MLAKVEKMAVKGGLGLLNDLCYRASGGMLPQKILVILYVLRCVLVHSGAF